MGDELDLKMLIAFRPPMLVSRTVTREEQMDLFDKNVNRIPFTAKQQIGRVLLNNNFAHAVTVSHIGGGSTTVNLSVLSDEVMQTIYDIVMFYLKK